MTKPRSLVVEDERIVNLDIQGALSRLGYGSVGAACSGVDGTPASRQRCLQTGIDQVLGKSADLEHLKNLLRGEPAARRQRESQC